MTMWMETIAKVQAVTLRQGEPKIVIFQQKADCTRAKLKRGLKLGKYMKECETNQDMYETWANILAYFFKLHFYILALRTLKCCKIKMQICIENSCKIFLNGNNVLIWWYLSIFCGGFFAVFKIFSRGLQWFFGVFMKHFAVFR